MLLLLFTGLILPFQKNPRVNSKGENTSAAFGFTTALLDILKKEKPSHIAVVFDAPGGATNRQEDYAEYKAHREEMPEDIRNMIDPIKEIVRAFKIPLLLKEGFEADDVIGTLARIAEEEGFTTYMTTPDKDFGQLVTENTFMYKPGRGGKPAEIWGIDEIKEKFEVEDPKQVIDILGLWGDSADNIPGIPEIGEKTSKKLIKKYGSMENLFEHTDDLKGKQKENVINFEEQGRMSKMLATIITDVDVPFDPEDLTYCDPDKEKVKEIFTQLEFKALAKKVLGEEIVITSNSSNTDGQLDLFGTSNEPEQVEDDSIKTIEDIEKEYQFIESEKELQGLIEKIMEQKSVCFDTETSSLEARNADLIGIAFSFEKNKAFYVPFPTEFEETKKNRSYLKLS